MRRYLAVLAATLVAACGTPQKQVTCGAGTHQDGTTCVLDSPACGAGTHLTGGACVPDQPRETCGAGTADDGGTCYPSPPPETCGPGTHDQNGTCVPDPADTYLLRISVAQIPADGHSKIPVFVIGQHADGTPITDPVVLDTSRPDAGAVAPAAFDVGAQGTTAYLTPCDDVADPSCLGTFQVTLALASDPTTPVATSGDLTLVAPTGVGSPALCLTGGNVVYLDGDAGDYVHPGTATITVGSFTEQHRPTDVPTDVSIQVVPSDPSQGTDWSLDFGSTQLGVPLTPQVYDDAERDSFASPGHPGIDIGGDGRGCNTDTGRFQVEDLKVTGGKVTAFTATFEQHCEGASATLRGCVHFQQ